MTLSYPQMMLHNLGILLSLTFLVSSEPMDCVCSAFCSTNPQAWNPDAWYCDGIEYNVLCEHGTAVQVIPCALGCDRGVCVSSDVVHLRSGLLLLFLIVTLML
jgi:hypothetical protein